MTKIIPKESLIKNGLTIRIRTAESGDASPMLKIRREVIWEGKYFITSAEEFDDDVRKQQKWIRSHVGDHGKLLIVAEAGHELIGVLRFSNGSRKRNAHSGSFSMMVRKSWRGLGVGTKLVETLFEWAKDSPIIEKVGLNVLASNSRAIALYKKLGFIEEGRRIKEYKFAEDRYEDGILMYWLVK